MMAGAGPGRWSNGFELMTGGSTRNPTATAMSIALAHLDPVRFSIDRVIQLFAKHFQPWYQSDSRELSVLCIALARGIDYAIANNDIPPRAQELPSLLKQVYHRKNELQTQAAVMVLMISVKNACKHGWFLFQDADELLAISNQLARSFSSPTDVNIESGSLPVVIPDVMSRFFPRMKIEHVLASLEVKPGYRAYASDFHILRDKSSPQEKICLFVVQTDNTSTSSCLVSPPKVNFLLNGKGVENRIDIAMDNGPQLPTTVTKMLKYGTNLLQAVGQFNGNYSIAVAFTSMIKVSSVPALQDYVPPAAVEQESDSEIIEGAARISLNCPISFSRIKTPVKGQLCKHHQCFDFENYIDINSRRPSWRCPHCNQTVCYLDICIDQNMVKVLREVAGNVSDIILSADGSWKPMMDSDAQTEDHDTTLGNNRDESMHCESTRSPNTVTNVVDLTMEDTEENNAMNTYDFEDRKPFKDVDPGDSAAGLRMPSEIHNASEVTQNFDSRIEDEFFPGVYLPRSPSFNGSASPVPSDFPATNSMVTPVLTDAVSPAYYRELADARIPSQARDSMMQAQTYATNNLQMHHVEAGNSFLFKDFGRSMPAIISRSPIAIQALPAQSQVPPSHHRSRTNMNPLLSNGSHTDALNNSAERQQQFSRSLANTSSLSDMSSSTMMHYSMPQNHQGSPYIQSSLPQVVGLPAASQVPSSRHNNPHYASSMGVGLPQQTSQSPTMHTSSRFHPGQSQQVGAQGTSGLVVPNRPPVPTGYRSSRVPRTLPVQPVQLQAPRTGSSFPMPTDGLRTPVADQRGSNMGSVSRADATNESQSEQDWRPTGRMRGSLQGRAYSAALNQFFIHPNQSSQTGTPSPDRSSPNNTNTHGITQNMYTTGDP